MEEKIEIKNIFNRAYSKKCKYASESIYNGQKVNIREGVSTISGVFVDLIYHYVQGDIDFSLIGNKVIAKSEKFSATWDKANKKLDVVGETPIVKGVHWILYSPLLYELTHKNGYIADSKVDEHIESLESIKDCVEGLGRITDLCLTQVAQLCHSLYYSKDNNYPSDAIQTIDVPNKIKDEPVKTKTKKKEKNKAKDDKKVNINEYNIPFYREFSEEEKSRIPKMNINKDIQVPEYVMNCAKIVKGEFDSVSPIKNLLWYGPAGTGKSFSTKILAQLLNLPHYQFIFSKGIDEMSIVAGAEVNDGTVSYNDSEIVKAVRDGGIVEFQELYNAQPSVLTFLNEVLQEGYLRLANGKVIKRNPYCIIVATSNINYAGCQNIDFSTDDRFVLQEHIFDIDDDTLIRRVIYESGNKNEVLIKSLVKAYRDIKRVLEEEEWDEGVVSIRKLVSWAQLCKYNNKIIENADKTILSGISKDYNERKRIIDNYFIHYFPR